MIPKICLILATVALFTACANYTGVLPKGVVKKTTVTHLYKGQEVEPFSSFDPKTQVLKQDPDGRWYVIDVKP